MVFVTRLFGAAELMRGMMMLMQFVETVHRADVGHRYTIHSRSPHREQRDSEIQQQDAHAQRHQAPPEGSGSERG